MIHWQEKGNSRDYDNVVFAKKFILDGLVNAGVLKNDNPRWVHSAVDASFKRGSSYKVTVEIKEAEQDEPVVFWQSELQEWIKAKTEAIRKENKGEKK